MKPYLRVNTKKGQHTVIVASDEPIDGFTTVDYLEGCQFLEDNADVSNSRTVFIDVIPCRGGNAVYCNNTRISGRGYKADGQMISHQWQTSMGYLRFIWANLMEELQYTHKGF